ncbi:MAG: LexA family protein [Lachnotalea sp.]
MGVENGDIVIVQVGEEVLCRKLIKYPDSIRLMPFNPTCEPKYFTDDEIENLSVIIIGKVIESRRKYTTKEN